MYKDEIEEYDDKTLESLNSEYGDKFDYSEMNDMLSEQNYYIDKFILGYGKKYKDVTNSLIDLKSRLTNIESVKISDIEPNREWLNIKTIVLRVIFIADKVIQFLSNNGTKLGVFGTLGEVFSMILLETELIENVVKIVL